MLPEIYSIDAFMTEKDRGQGWQAPDRYEDIEMPANSALGVVIAITGLAMAFGLVWYMWWLVIAAGLVTLVAIIARGFVRQTTRTISASEVQRTHEHWLEQVRRTTPINRSQEQTTANHGLPVPPIEGAVQ